MEYQIKEIVHNVFWHANRKINELCWSGSRWDVWGPCTYESVASTCTCNDTCLLVDLHEQKRTVAHLTTETQHL